MKPSYSYSTLINISHGQLNQCAETVEFTLVYINFTQEKQREKHKGRDTRCDKSLRHVAATGCCNKSPRVTCENPCRCDRILSPRSVARIQTGLNSCDKSQRQNKHKQPCRTVCTHLRQIAATKFKSTNEEASFSFPPC